MPSRTTWTLIWTEWPDSWFHFLCKNVPVEDFDGVKHIVNKNKRDAKDLSQADFTWVRSAYCLKTKPPTQTSSCSETTLIVFGGEMLLWEKFDALASSTSCQEILEDPYCLMDIVFEILYARIDRLAWDLARVYSQEEEVRSNLTPMILEHEFTWDLENPRVGISSRICGRRPRFCGVAHAVKAPDLPFGSDGSCDSDTRLRESPPWTNKWRL